MVKNTPPASSRRRGSTSRSIPVLEGVEKGSNSRLFGLSVIPAKAGVHCEMDPAYARMTAGGEIRHLRQPRRRGSLLRKITDFAELTMVSSQLPFSSGVVFK